LCISCPVLIISVSQVIGCEDCPQNELDFVGLLQLQLLTEKIYGRSNKYPKIHRDKAKIFPLC